MKSYVLSCTHKSYKENCFVISKVCICENFEMVEINPISHAKEVLRNEKFNRKYMHIYLHIYKEFGALRAQILYILIKR